MKNRIFGVAILASLVWGCSTEVDLNADWKDTTVVYGLLDAADDIHYVRINRAFLGEGNAYDMALVQDSSEYQNVTAVVEELSGNTVIRTWTLDDTIMTDRPADGIFYSPNYKLYYFTEPALNDIYNYRIRVTIGETGKEITGTTELVKSFSVNPPLTFSFSSNNIGSNTYYSPAIKWGQSPNGVKYEVSLYLKLDEYTASGVTRKVLEWPQGTYDPSSLSTSGNSQYTVPVSGEAFYKYLANKLSEDPNVIARKFRSIDMVVYAASEELDAYMQLNAPSNSIVQERPEYTNISNGLGLFSSRLHVVAKNKYISEFSMEELCLGTYTSIQKDLKFCTDSSVYASKPYYCP